MFDTLSERLNGILDRLTRRGALTEADVDAALREVRRALLEADVALDVARAFIDKVRSSAVGVEVIKSVTPGQMVVKIVHDQLIATLGSQGEPVDLNAPPPVPIMMVGLQGSGKTTTAAKLARLYTKQGQHPMLAAADTQRPAAMDQLRTLGAQLGVPVTGTAGQTPLQICRAAREEAASRGLTPLILDTAGRLHIDEALLAELQAIRREVAPHHVLLVVDAMTGQDAVTVADKFNQAVGIDAVVLTKMDGDSRGGAALSVRHVTGRPIAFVGVGEKSDALEPFHPDRLASRILGMGDVLSLVEKAQAAVDQTKAEALAKKLREDTFTLEDFRDQLKQLRQMGPLDQILGMLPFGKMLKGTPKDLDGESADLDRFDAIICSMTPGERNNPEVINGSRRQRIARGSGTNVQDVNRLLKQFAQLRKVMKQFKGMEGKLPRGMKNLPGFPR